MAEQTHLALRVVAGRAAGARVPVGAEPVVFGRAEQDVGGLGGDPELSREHAKVSAFDGQLLVEDLGSTNGTFVNGGQVAGPTVVSPGDAIWMGTSTLLVQGGGEPPPEVPPAEPPTPSAEAGFLSRIATIADRRPKRMLGLVAVFFVIAAAIGGPVTKQLKDNQGFQDRGAESFKADKRLAKAGNAFPGARTIVLYSAGQDVTSPAVADKVKAIAAGIRRDKDVARVLDVYSTGSSFFVSRDRAKTYIAVFFKNIGQQQREDASDRLKKRFDNQPGVSFGGQAVANPELREQVRMDLGKAEALGIPLLLLASLFVFRGLVAALLPLFVGLITVFGTFLALRIINGIVPVNVFALNIVTGLGLGLAIDYSLFVLSRYREELVRVGKGRPENATYGASEVAHGATSGEQFVGSEAEALRRTMMTAGRTITFSATTVAVALASLIVFPQPFLYSMGIGGAVCSLVAVSTALVALPALLAALGPRVNALSPKRWQRAAERSASEVREGFWYRLSQGVMRRPGFVAILSASFLIAVGLAFTRVSFTGVNSGTLPNKLEAKKVSQTLSKEFPVDPSAGVQIALEAPASAGPRIAAYAATLDRLPDVAATFPPTRVGGNLWELDIQPWGGGLDDRTVQLVKDIRNRGSPFPIQVAGESAEFVDQQASFASHLPIALAILAASTLFILFVMTGSVVLPLKSLLMNLLTISATLGLLVLIFQDGRFESLLDFQSRNALDASQPILIAAIAFGLSTDYAVFLLGRINEARIHGASDREAVAIGLERTGRLVTQAAFLFCLAIGVFATSQVIFIKQVGVGTAAAVLIDATIVRALLVPSLMAMLGARNWWAPKPLRRLHNRIGFSEA